MLENILKFLKPAKVDITEMYKSYCYAINALRTIENIILKAMDEMFLVDLNK